VIDGRAETCLRVVAGDGRIWSALADELLLEIRAGLVNRPRSLRLSVPWLADGPLHARITGRFQRSLGERELRPVTLPELLARYIDIGGVVDVITRNDAPAAEQLASDERLSALVARAPTRVQWRKVDGARALLVVAAGFALFAPWRPPGDQGGVSGGTGEMGLLMLGEEARRELERGFEELWRRARPARPATPGVPDAR